ncbi:hypothetical protein CCR83_14705 [Rhodobacter veldkampii DSM 11550]|uniref:DUF2842 domain-containing protein n=1 Tax=Phaeovulum veldkampii DSM 11550 TaxID=1185920 RepID=A0A2T4JNK1_9RHOB|nr:DUF2842 domain-containing protein [Phaeovulum veldkampii]MBK5947661.1 hypothetical protein [Phaeovulum veldkampii DSM 11550]NCU21207.1 DUF2842 domain-containing protein [Candidatus Falkowbacteria bacterium]PTE19337.1 DUF2842 domain-containing protein [Phaeovulum veldkampii DSM 11550]TDQ62167.1 uncharacterized protein DUF2842 [Phaeovulum veldkampii DSM 11550]
MALGYKTRRRLALLILLVGMPLYVAAAVTAVNWFDRTWGRLPIWAEVLVYLALGVIWILPFKAVFRGVGQPDPQAEKTGDRTRDAG